MKSNEFQGTRIYEIPEIEDVKNIPDRVPLIQIDYETQTSYFQIQVFKLLIQFIHFKI